MKIVIGKKGGEAVRLPIALPNILQTLDPANRGRAEESKYPVSDMFSWESFSPVPGRFLVVNAPTAT